MSMKMASNFLYRMFLFSFKVDKSMAVFAKKYTGVFILEDQIGRFGDFDIWNKTLIVRVA